MGAKGFFLVLLLFALVGAGAGYGAAQLVPQDEEGAGARDGGPRRAGRGRRGRGRRGWRRNRACPADREGTHGGRLHRGAS